ncbi:hypothetical protein ACFPRL_35780 [Pseudoclavibacter helvolus]
MDHGRALRARHRRHGAHAPRPRRHPRPRRSPPRTNLTSAASNPGLDVAAEIER